MGDNYRNDHPVMQFVARQRQLMNEGLSKKDAFSRTEELFRQRREYLENEQKVMMAMALDMGVQPMFATGQAYLHMEKARGEAAHLNQIRQQLRRMKQREQDLQAEKEEKTPDRRFAASRQEEHRKLLDLERERQALASVKVPLRERDEKVDEEEEEEEPEEVLSRLVEKDEDREVAKAAPPVKEALPAP